MPAPMTEPPTRPLILLVDDDAIVRLTLARALTDRGYDVRTAADGQAAITILEGLGRCRRSRRQPTARPQPGQVLSCLWPHGPASGAPRETAAFAGRSR